VISLSLVFSCRAEIRRLIAGSFCQGRLCADDCCLFWDGGSSRFQFRLIKYVRPVGILYLRFVVLLFCGRKDGGGEVFFVVF
jgi:hypothetical protein